ncbi:MAG TPA: hypothetical protein VIJ20_09895 [Solirubrobacteraceae bacterium]
MSKFTDRLWRELERGHGAELEQMSRPAPKRRRRPQLLLGSTVALAGVGTTLALVLGAASSSPAFAVTRNHDGTITVRIMRTSGIAGANARLAALGVRARAVPVLAGCSAPTLTPVRLGSLRDQAVVARALLAARQAARKGVLNARIDPRKIPAGRVLVFEAKRAAVMVHAAAGQAVAELPPACLAQGSPPCAVPSKVASGNTGNSGATGDSGATVGAPAACKNEPPPSSLTGNTGNSGATGNSG